MQRTVSFADLDGTVAGEARVARAVDDAHPAGAEASGDSATALPPPQWV